MPGSSTRQILTSFLAACLVRRCVCVLWSQQKCVVREVGRQGGKESGRSTSVVVWVCVSTSIKIKSLMTLACPCCTIIGHIRSNSLRALTDPEKFLWRIKKTGWMSRAACCQRNLHVVLSQHPNKYVILKHLVLFNFLIIYIFTYLGVLMGLTFSKRLTKPQNKY